MLKLEGLNTHYGKSHILQGVNIEVGDGEAVALLGRNGVGKTTTLRSIMGLTPPSAGAVTFAGTRVDRIAPYRIPRLGLGYVPQGRHIFPKLTVLENLCIGLVRAPAEGDLDDIYEQFPILEERATQQGGTLSGGEQQMLAMARGLMSQPRVLLLDEPSMGLAPMLVEQVFEAIEDIRRQGVAVLLVEQNAFMALQIADRAYVIETGEIVLSGAAEELLENDEVKRAYLG